MFKAQRDQVFCSVIAGTGGTGIWSQACTLKKNLSLAALGLHCSAWAFSSCGEQGLLFVVVRGLLIAVASLVVEHRL